jgi:anti-anti-sigma factor
MPTKLLDGATTTTRAPEEVRCTGGLLISDSAFGAQHTLHLQGELDLASASDLLASASLLVYDASELVLDLRGLDFIDSTGLNVILRLRDLCRNHYCRLVLKSPGHQVRRLLEVTALIEPLRDQGVLGA